MKEMTQANKIVEITRFNRKKHPFITAPKSYHSTQELLCIEEQIRNDFLDVLMSVLKDLTKRLETEKSVNIEIGIRLL